MVHSGLYGKSRRTSFAEGKFFITLSNTRLHPQKTGTSAAGAEAHTEE
jgi:hypothetical protein